MAARIERHVTDVNHTAQPYHLSRNPYILSEAAVVPVPQPMLLQTETVAPLTAVHTRAACRYRIDSHPLPDV